MARVRVVLPARMLDALGEISTFSESNDHGDACSSDRGTSQNAQSGPFGSFLNIPVQGQDWRPGSWLNRSRLRQYL